MGLPARQDTLDGATYKVRLGDGSPMYITVNSQDGQPYEIFVRHDAPELFEWATALTVLITRLLRAGQTMADIARELQQIHSPVTSHMILGTDEKCPGIVARIGQVLEGAC